MVTVCGHSILEYHIVAHYTDPAGGVEVTQSVLTACSHPELEHHIVALYIDQAGALQVTQSMETVCGHSAGDYAESHHGPALDLVVKVADHASTAGSDHWGEGHQCQV